MGPPALSSEVRCDADFYRPYKSIASAGFERATLESSGKHTNHYTIEATNEKLLFVDLLFKFFL
jgi:hypothetical protein